MSEVSEREKLELQCRVTVSFHFGSICDELDRYAGLGKISREDVEKLKKVVRNNGNDAIRVIGSHLEYFKIARNHRMDKVNSRRVARIATEEMKG